MAASHESSPLISMHISSYNDDIVHLYPPTGEGSKDSTLPCTFDVLHEVGEYLF